MSKLIIGKNEFEIKSYDTEYSFSVWVNTSEEASALFENLKVDGLVKYTLDIDGVAIEHEKRFGSSTVTSVEGRLFVSIFMTDPSEIDLLREEIEALKAQIQSLVGGKK